MDKKTLALMVVAILYWLFPDLLPGLPVDDILVTIVCALLAKNGKGKEIDDKSEV